MRKRSWILRGLTAMALGVGAVAFLWFWVIQTASGLERADIVEVVMATNRIHRSLWEIGYRPEDCAPITDLDPRYTCVFKGDAAEQVEQALRAASRSYYLLGKPLEGGTGDAVHVLSFKMEDGGSYLLVARDLNEADQGIFYGYRAESEAIQEREIRWFRYTNPQLGQVLKGIRAGR